MIAPAHISGKIGRHAPEHLRQERLQWVRDNADLAGDRLASALDLTRASVATLRRQAGVMPPPWLGKPSERGIRYGAVSRALEGMPYARHAALEDAAARTGQTMADSAAFFNKPSLGFTVHQVEDEEQGNHVQVTTWKVRNTQLYGFSRGRIKLRFHPDGMTYSEFQNNAVYRAKETA